MRVVFRACRSDIQLESVREPHHGGAKTIVNGHRGFCVFGECPSEADAIPLYHHIDIKIVDAEKEVADEPPDDIGPVA